MIRCARRFLFPQIKFVRQQQTNDAQVIVEETEQDRSLNLNEVIVQKDETISKLQKEIETLKRGQIDLFMEIKSMRHRGEKELETIKSIGCKKFAKDMIEVADALEMAINVVSEDTVCILGENTGDSFQREFKNVFDGILITQKILSDSFSRNGVKSIKPKQGDNFDPALHHAKFEIPSTDDGPPPKTIGEVIRFGYLINGQLIRPAEVGVIKYEN
ncbi:Protein GrpE [Thelohanellus kitauei]|uniref:Protein GrpE n=1 Tax=Thelohanellus kitauei TaxID=669202 RepID=A0A0C2N041_THEKT|nr:Protein GrpE [Thelohanellus kitauei]